ncbi:MAG: hypothetical protein V4541_04430 [Bacteroidota bacterium]
MRKVLLTVMMVSSLLAFNACKKDGVQGPAGAAGPAGPAGPAGAAGAAGAVGPAGAKGADGTKILSGTVDPTTEGAVGDFYFQKTSKTLWGPKVAAGWAGTSTGLTGATGAPGAPGAVGATGAAGNKFLAGAGVPDANNPTNAKTGDFYFNTTTSTFYGPKQADGTWASVLPLSSDYAAKTYYLTKGFENVTQVGNNAYSQYLASSWGLYEIFSSYKVNAGDLIRINQYPGWGENREMIFQTVPGSGVFDAVPTNGMGLTPDAGTVGAVGTPFEVGAKFRYTNNVSGVALPGGGVSSSTAEFTLTTEDVARLTVNNGAAFGYLTYAKALQSSVVVGSDLVFARTKQVAVKTSTTDFAANYTARTTFNLNTLVPNFEAYKQEGKVFVKYRYYTPGTAVAATNNVPVQHATANAGWVDITDWANSYALASAAKPANGNVPAVPALAGYSTVLAAANPFTAFGANFMTSGSVLGTTGVAVPFGVNQSATAQVGTVANPTINLDGNVRINWTIASGTNFAGGVVTTKNVGPMTLTNTGGDLDVVGTANFVPRAFATEYYSAPGALTAVGPTGTALVIPAGQTIDITERKGGLTAAQLGNTKLVQIQVFVIPGKDISALKAKGVNTDNLNEIAKNIKL